jgi:hypothetical protein
MNTKTATSKYSYGNLITITDYGDSFEFFKLKEWAITDLIMEAAKIVEFLQKAYYVKIEMIVLDFIRDKSNTWWFLGCKGFRLDRSIQLARELRAKEIEGKSYAVVQ